MPYICPICSKNLKTAKSLRKHQKTFDHFDKAASGKEAPGSTPPAQALEVKIPKEKTKESGKELPPQGTVYHCLTCGQDNLKRGTPLCPGCGRKLKWDLITEVSE